MSYAEANMYLGVTYEDKNNLKALVTPTAFAKAQGAFVAPDRYKTADGELIGSWWLRSPAGRQSSALDVIANGSLDGAPVNFEKVSVRPALWMNLESDLKSLAAK